MSELLAIFWPKSALDRALVVAWFAAMTWTGVALALAAR